MNIINWPESNDNAVIWKIFKVLQPLALVLISNHTPLDDL
jgi:hypothetical protein